MSCSLRSRHTAQPSAMPDPSMSNVRPQVGPVPLTLRAIPELGQAPSSSGDARDVIVAVRKLYGRVGFQPPWICYLAFEAERCVGTCGFTYRGRVPRRPFFESWVSRTSRRPNILRTELSGSGSLVTGLRANNTLERTVDHCASKAAPSIERSIT